MKKVIFLLSVAGVSAIFAQTGSFQGIDNVVTDFDGAGQSILGTGVRWVIGMLPLILFVVGVFGGVKYAKRQADQDQDNTKVYVTAVIGGVAGTMVGLLLIALIGAALLGEASAGLDVLKAFWGKALGTTGTGA